VKVKVGRLSIEADSHRIRAVRAAIGPEVALMIDANGSYRPKEALALWELVSDLGIAWLEEPIPCDDAHAAAWVADKVSCPVAGYETEGTAAGFRQLIEVGAVDIVQPDATWCGGVTEARRIAMLAEAADLQFAAHAYGSAVGFVANLHVLASVRSPAPAELDVTANDLRDCLTDPTVPELVCDGLVTPPSGPGLGIELRADALERYEVAR
jgi:L-alanine-DL-glutamate epimerase-like enolase superfamily enzyme